VIEWNSRTYHTLETSIKHVEDPKYFSFLKIICCRTPMEEEISLILNNCYIVEDLIEQYIDDKQQYFAHIERTLIITMIWFFTINF
jgi:hypothetical protein